MKKILSILGLLAISVSTYAQTTIQFSTLNQLQLYSINNTNRTITAFVAGASDYGDGGGGLFAYIGTASDTTNAYSIVKPLSWTGRWIRLTQGSLLNQASALTPADQTTYALQILRGATNKLGLGSSDTASYIQSWDSQELQFNQQGNRMRLGPVGSGGSFSGVFSTNATLDFPSIDANGVTNLTVSIAGVAANDTVIVGPPTTATAGITFGGYVSASDTVSVRAANPTVNAIDPASATYRVTIIHY